jgi:ABC-type antimicrobial peptide transport system permease subunit
VRLGGPDGHELHVIGAPPPTVFLPAGQHSSNQEMTLLAHTNDAAAATIAGIEKIVRDFDPALAAYGATTMDRASRNAVKPQQSAAMIGTVVGALALLLAVVGLYGVVAYTVDRRKREVGIRMALGASRTAVLTMVLRRAGITALFGLGIGLALALLTGRLMTSLLFEVQPHDPIVLGVVTLTLAVVVLIASWVPARRASRVDPLIALRMD